MKTWHKRAIIIIVIIGIIVCVKSCIDKKDADITLAYIGEGFVDRVAFDENKDELLNVCTDVNSDGEKCVEIMEISFNQSLSPADKDNSDKKLANALGAGVARVYFIEEKYVMANASKGVFEPLDNLGDGFKNSNGEVVAINITGNEKLAKMGIDTDKDLYLAVRVVSEMDIVLDKNIDKKHKMAMDIAEYILS